MLNVMTAQGGAKMAEKTKQSGQALIEYMPVMTTVGTAAFLILIPLSSRLGDILSRIPSSLSPNSSPPAANVVAAPLEEPLIEEKLACVDFQASNGASQCDHDRSCSVLNGINSGFYVDPGGAIETLVIKAGQNYVQYSAGHTNDGCYDVIIDGATVSWQRIGSGSNCKNISHLQSWRASFCQ